jgi:hypothetical protein
MPGPVSDSSAGPSDDAPYVPSWCYTNGPRMCPCGHHEGYHSDGENACSAHAAAVRACPRTAGRRLRNLEPVADVEARVRRLR